jgi:cell division protein FtsL
MTILEPHKEKFHIDLLIALLIVLLFGGTIGAVYLYNETVNFRHTMKSYELEIVNLQNKNVELRNELYGALDPKHLLSVAKEAGFVLEQKPSYLEPAQKEKLANNL